MKKSLAALSLSTVLLTGSALGAAGVSAHSRGDATQQSSLVLDWYPNSDHGGLYDALSQGYFSRQHIAMKAYVPSNTTAQIPLVASGRADFGITYETDLLAARARGIPVQSVMCIMQHPLDTVMALKSSGITRPRDLEGKTIGMAGSPSDRPLVSAMMAHDGSNISKAHMVTLGFSLLSALIARKVDAVVGLYWTWEAIQAQMIGKPVNVMRVEQWGVPNYCELVLVAKETTIRRRPALVLATVHAMQDGYAFAATHPNATWNALHRADKALERALVITSLGLLRAIVTDAPTVGYQRSVQWRNYAHWLAVNRLITRPVNSAQAFTNRFLFSGVH